VEGVGHGVLQLVLVLALWCVVVSDLPLRTGWHGVVGRVGFGDVDREYLVVRVMEIAVVRVDVIC